MVSNKTKARLGVKATTTVARNPALRRATIRAGVPAAKVVVKRQMRNQMERIGPAARTAGSIVAIYGPMTAEALGLEEGAQAEATGAGVRGRSRDRRCSVVRPPKSARLRDVSARDVSARRRPRTHGTRRSTTV